MNWIVRIEPDKRLNYPIAGSHHPAENTELIYSLLATAKLNGLEPFTWLRDTRNRIHEQSSDQIAELLPLKK